MRRSWFANAAMMSPNTPLLILLSAHWGERKGPIAQRWEGEVGALRRRTFPPHPGPLPPMGGEGAATGDAGCFKHRASLHRPVLVHRLDFAWPVAEPAEDFVGVLAEQRGAAVFRRRVVQVDRHPDLDVRAAGRMVEPHQHLAVVKRLVLVDVLCRQDRAA